MSKIRDITSYLGSIASMYAIIEHSDSKWIYVVYFLFAVSFLHTIYTLLRDDCDKITCKNNQAINDEMEKIVSHPGRLLIMTRDMSWCKVGTIWSKLIQKAERRELDIFMQKQTPDSGLLENCGANINYYGKTGFEPKVRFTIMHYKTSSSKVAIGYKNSKDKHVIQYYRVDTSSPGHLAEDVAQLLEKNT